MNIKNKILTTATIFYAVSALSAQIMVNYGFDSDATIFNPTISDSNIQGSVFSIGSSVTSVNIDSTSALAQSGRSLFGDNASFNATAEAAAKTNGDYLSVTLAVASGFQADLSNLSFYTLRQTDAAASGNSGEGAPSAWSIFSDANGDDFATQIASGTISLADNSTFTLQSADLSSLDTITGTTEFRIFLWAPQGIGEGIDAPSQRAWRMDELSISGTTAAVPEPTTFGLLAGVMALGFILWRRRSI